MRHIPGRTGAPLLVMALALFGSLQASAQSLTVMPSNYPTVPIGGTMQFTATANGFTISNIKWEVASVQGGSAATGTITTGVTGGLYTAPAAIPTQNPQAILAVATDMNGNKYSASTYVMIASPPPAISTVSPTPLPTGTVTVTVTGTAFSPSSVIWDGGVSYTTKQTGPNTLQTSVYTAPGTTSASFTVHDSGQVSGALTVPIAGSSSGGGGSSNGGSSGGSTAPVIANVSPNPLPAGTVTVTVTGTGFASNSLIWDGGVQYTTNQTGANTLTTSLYTAPGTTSATFTVHNPGQVSNAVTVQVVPSGPPPPQTIAPLSASVNLGATQQFTSAGATAFVATAGSITSTGLYTAPTTMPPSGNVTVTATGPGGNASAAVTLVNPNPQLIAPAAVTLALGATQQFVSAGGSNWTAINGTITSAGLYTAPSVWPASGADTVSVTGPNGKATAAITLTPPTPVVTGVGVNNQLPLGIFNAAVAGTGFTAQSTVTLGTTPVTTGFSNGTLTINGFYGQSGPVNLIVTNGTVSPVSSQPFSVQVGVPNAQVSTSAARRFLQQAGFGPSPADAAHVQAIGFQAWLNEQFAMPQVSNYNADTGSQGGMPPLFLANAVTNPDQLRQKVGFALSQIFVTSLNKIVFDTAMVPYQNMLLADAFTNYQQILTDVTLSPAMGYYLDMANNAKANPVLGTAANENYAREIMQLMSIGTKVLNPDGTWPVDSNNLPIPTYQQSDVTAMARIFTGWTYAAGTPGSMPIFGSYINPSAPMVPFSSQHDTTAKTVMGYSAPAGLSPADDLNGVLAYLAAHPNTAPFISKQLIEHMVKSNPSPQYVLRVSTAFTRSSGDMPTVISAILLDPEARANDQGGADQPNDGHLQEPALLVPAVVRAFAGQMTTANWYASTLASMGQDLFSAPSVFNYYSPGYTVGGTGGLLGPEFQIDNPNAAVLRENFVANLTNSYSNPILSYGPGTTIDLTPFLALAANPAALVNAIDLTLTEGVMPQGLKTIILIAVSADASGALHQVETAVYLTLISSYYNVWH